MGLPVARDEAGSGIGFAGFHHEALAEGAGERLAILADADFAGAGGVGVGREAGVDLHEEQASGALRDGEFLENRSDFRVGAVVNGALEAVDVDFQGHAEDGVRAASGAVPDPEHDGAAAAIGHADGHFDHEFDRIVGAAGIPLLEIEILILQLVGEELVELGQEFEDLFGGAHEWPEVRGVRPVWTGRGDVASRSPLGSENF